MSEVQLSQIGQIALPVRDLDRAVAFYRDVLGMRFLFQAPGLAFFDCGGIRLMLGVHEGEEEERRSSILYYRVDDLEQAVATLGDQGVAFVEGPHRVARMEDHDLWMAFFRDPEGNVAALMSEVRPARAESAAPQ